jgi:CRISPR-associated protein Cas2
MLMMVMEAVPIRLRGELTRWLSPLTAQVFVGRVTPVVRDMLWKKAVHESASGRVVQAWSAPHTERGFEFRMNGFDGVATVDLEGVLFTSVRDAAWLEAQQRFGLWRDREGA